MNIRLEPKEITDAYSTPIVQQTFLLVESKRTAWHEFLRFRLQRAQQ